MITAFSAQGASRIIDADQSTGLDVKTTAKRHELGRHMDLHRKHVEMLAAAEEDIARNTPPIPAADTVGSASIDGELRAHFRGLSDEQRTSLKGVSDAAKLAVARAPAELSGLLPEMHARVVDEVRRKTFPEKMAELDGDRRVIAAAKLALDAHKSTAVQSLGHEVERASMRITAAAA